MLWTKLLAPRDDDLPDVDEDAEQLWAEVAERTRFEYARTSLADRLRGRVGELVRLELAGAVVVEGTVQGVGADWVALDEPLWSCVLRLDAVVEANGLGTDRRSAGDGLDARLGFTVLLRRMARDREEVRVTRVDGRVLAGRLNRIGRDHVDLVVSDGEGSGRMTDVRSVPLAAVAVVRISR